MVVRRHRLLTLFNSCYAAIQRFKKIMRSLSRRLLFRVFALEGEILSFAQPLERGDSIAAQSAALGFIWGR